LFDDLAHYQHFPFYARLKEWGKNKGAGARTKEQGQKGGGRSRKERERKSKVERGEGAGDAEKEKGWKKSPEEELCQKRFFRG
jgi:hypothetical protein